MINKKVIIFFVIVGFVQDFFPMFDIIRNYFNKRDRINKLARDNLIIAVNDEIIKNLLHHNSTWREIIIKKEEVIEDQDYIDVVGQINEFRGRHKKHANQIYNNQTNMMKQIVEQRKKMLLENEQDKKIILHAKYGLLKIKLIEEENRRIFGKKKFLPFFFTGQNKKI